jgi:hypothetical protein
VDSAVARIENTETTEKTDSGPPPPEFASGRVMRSGRGDVRPQLLARRSSGLGIDQDEGEHARGRPAVDPGVHRAALDDDIARHFVPINGPNVKPDYAIGSVEWQLQQRRRHQDN